MSPVMEYPTMGEVYDATDYPKNPRVTATNVVQVTYEPRIGFQGQREVIEDFTTFDDGDFDEIMFASEAAIGNVWLSTEEDEAWQDL